MRCEGLNRDWTHGSHRVLQQNIISYLCLCTVVLQQDIEFMQSKRHCKTKSE